LKGSVKENGQIEMLVKKCHAPGDGFCHQPVSGDKNYVKLKKTPSPGS
jgi:hypothetical protein